MTEIREQRQSDSVEAIAQVYVQSWRSAYRGLLPDALLDGLTTARWTEKLALGGPLQSLVAVENGQIVGTCAYGAARSETMCGWGEIVSLYLLPQWTGRGLGRALLGRAVGTLRAAGHRKVYLWVLEKNDSARAFYERCGFAADGGVLTDTLGGKTVRDVRYILRAGNEMRRRKDGRTGEKA